MCISNTKQWKLKQKEAKIDIFFFEKGSSRLCLDYILSNLEIKLRPSETKLGHRMLAPGLKPGVDEIFHHIPLGLL